MATRVFRPQQHWHTPDTSFEFHEAAADYDPWTEEEIDRTAADMKTNGFDPRFPICLHNGKIVAGKNRYKSAKKAKVEFLTCDVSDQDPETFAKRENEDRRHETPERRAARTSKRREQVAELRQEGKSIRAIADKVGVSEATVHKDLSKGSGVNGLTPEPQNGEVLGKDGKSYQSTSTKPLCDGCRTRQRKGQDLLSRCPECAVVRAAAKRAKETGENPDADIPQSIPVPPEAVTDKVGHIVPDATLPAFEVLDKFEEMDTHCRALQKLIDETAKMPGGEQLGHFVQATTSGENTIHKSQHLNALKRDLRGTRPYSICPRCAGKKTPNCKGCDGVGWVSKITWDSFEDAVKARLS